jgi:hypothetical protein
MATRAAQGRIVRFRPNSQYDHRLDQVAISGSTATVLGCKIDDSVQVDSTGAVVDDSIQSATIEATFTRLGDVWLAADVRFTNQSSGISGCAS